MDSELVFTTDFLVRKNFLVVNSSSIRLWQLMFSKLSFTKHLVNHFRSPLFFFFRLLVCSPQRKIIRIRIINEKKKARKKEEGKLWTDKPLQCMMHKESRMSPLLGAGNAGKRCVSVIRTCRIERYTYAFSFLQWICPKIKHTSQPPTKLSEPPFPGKKKWPALFSIKRNWAGLF